MSTRFCQSGGERTACRRRRSTTITKRGCSFGPVGFAKPKRHRALSAAFARVNLAGSLLAQQLAVRTWPPDPGCHPLPRRRVAAAPLSGADSRGRGGRRSEMRSVTDRKFGFPHSRHPQSCVRVSARPGAALSPLRSRASRGARAAAGGAWAAGAGGSPPSRHSSGRGAEVDPGDRAHF
eukprot:scaffold77848_cov65-Phaeocystis_antarctica.AAC.3